MRYANLHLPGVKPVVECVPSGLFILPQKMQMKTRYADTLSISRRTKPGQGSLEVGENLLRLMFRGFGKRRKRLNLALHGSRADFFENAIHSHGAEEVGIRRFLNCREQVALCHRLCHLQLLLRVEKGDHRERCFLVIGNGTSGTVRSKLIERSVKANHLAIEVVKGAKAEVAVLVNLPVGGLAVVNAGHQSGHQRGLIYLSRSMIVATGQVVPCRLDHCE